MVKNNTFNGWSKVLVGLAVSLVAIAVAWGTVRNQVATNSSNVEKKLDKEVFQMYCEQQKAASEKTDRTLEKIDGKLDKLISGE